MGFNSTVGFGGAASSRLKEYTSDPPGKGVGQTWILKTLDVPAGELLGMFGGFPVTQSADTFNYQLSVMTSSGVRRTPLSNT